MHSLDLHVPTAELADFCEQGELPAIDPMLLARQRPDSLLRIGAKGRALARCALWWRETPPHASGKLGLIGHYAAADPLAAAELLRAATEKLAAQGCALAVGPMDGSSWERYRFVTAAGDEPPFLFEPANPPEWPAQFADAGFTAFAHYCSRIADDLRLDDPFLPPLKPVPQAEGIRLRPVNLAQPEADLRAIYTLSLASFGDNLLYQPIGWDAFAAQYRPLLPLLRPELATIAEQDDRPVGFIFGVHDLLQARRGAPIDTVILKTCGVLPELRGCGLGRLLIAHCRDQARRLGYRRAIYALMRAEGASHQISRDTTRLLRRYTLFARELA